LVSLPGQALAAQTLSIKGREERVKEMGVMSSSVHSPGDHDEESLPLPPGLRKILQQLLLTLTRRVV